MSTVCTVSHVWQDRQDKYTPCDDFPSRFPPESTHDEGGGFGLILSIFLSIDALVGNYTLFPLKGRVTYEHSPRRCVILRAINTDVINASGHVVIWRASPWLRIDRWVARRGVPLNLKCSVHFFL